jgi:mersacidin/lichenicidin family type 2 lantibiotic
MSRQEIIRAWKDAEFRANLSDAQRAMLPANPAGCIELTDSDLDRTVARPSGLRIKTTLKAGGKSSNPQ